MSETVTFEISNGAVKFNIEGEVGAGSISIKTTEEKVDLLSTSETVSITS